MQASATVDGYPEGPEFMRYVRQWLISPTDESCPLGGKASYSSALKLPSLDDDASEQVEDTVELSHFRTYHTPLKTQSDFIEALAAAQRISKDLSKRTGAEVFPYSLPYVFFQSCLSSLSSLPSLPFSAKLTILPDAQTQPSGPPPASS
jgi:Niemann-Pick C1 protein